MSSEAQSAEVAGTINELRISGRLLGNPELRQFATGTKCVQAMLAVPKYNGKGAMHIAIKLWVNDTNMGLIEHFLTYHEGDNVVCSGSLSINFFNGKTYVDTDITKGSIE